jgi:RimJ/RimL family protein N-acetyltransferase
MSRPDADLNRARAERSPAGTRVHSGAMTRTPGPTLETDRLLLRPPQAEDLTAWAAYAADEEAMRYVGGLQSACAAWRSLCAAAGAWIVRGFSLFSVIEKSTGRWIGRLGPWQPEDWPGTEVGWSMVRDVWGRGYAREGATAAIDYAFDVLGWTEVIHCIDPRNVASSGLAQRLGSTVLRQTCLPLPFDQIPVDVWGQTREQWRARKG